MPIHTNLLNILVCPINKTPLQWDKKKDELIAVEAGLAYPIRDQIPVMLIEEARQLSEEELKKWKKKSHPTPPPKNTPPS